MLKRFIFTSLFAFIATVLPQVAEADFLTSFSSPTYSDGGLIGQDNWLATGMPPSTVNPILVQNTASNGNVALTTTGQDVNRSINGNYTAGSSVFLSADINLSAAQANGDYFLHLSDGSSSNFNSRIYARSSAGGFQMALGTGSGAVTYGTTELALNTLYRILARYDIIAGTLNDTGALFVNPIDPFGIGDTPYVAATTVGTDAVSITAVNLRQGTAGNAPTLTIDNINVTGVTAIPEPSSLALLGVTALGGMVYRRRTRV